MCRIAGSESVRRSVCRRHRGEKIWKRAEKTEEENKLNNLTLEEHYKYYEKQGFDKKEIIKKIAKDRNVNKNEIYMKFI